MEEEEYIKECIKNSQNLEFLGKGSFGTVFKLDYKGTNYAIKIISKRTIDNNPKVPATYMKKVLNRELYVLKKMSEFENSVKFYYYFLGENNDHIIVLELCDSDLQKLLDEKGKFTSSEILSIMEGLNIPFKYMHNNNLIHRDIKPENIMIKYVDSSKKKFIPKIADYGLARELKDGMAFTTLGTEGYMAPEIMLEEDYYTDKSDLYSIGVMMYQFYFNSLPFDIPPKYKKKEKVIEQIFNRKKKEDCEDKILDDLLNKLLVYDPDKRISWEEYFQHPFFNQNKGVEDLNKKVENLKIYDEKEHQIINYPDIALENLISQNYEEKETIKNIPPKKLVSIDECLNLKDKPFFILGILGKYLETIGISVVIEKDESSRKGVLKHYHKNIIQSICNSYIYKHKYLLDFDFDESKLKNLLKNDIYRRHLKEKLKNILLKKYYLKEEEVFIYSLVRDKNKFTIVIVIKSNYNLNITKEDLIKEFEEKYQELTVLTNIEKELITPTIKLNKSMLYPKEDNKNDKWSKGEKRGGEDYIPPRGWIMYAIKIDDHNFDEKNFNWFSHFHQKGEWAVAYCGITGITKKIEQIYEKDDDIRHQGKKVGTGVYCFSDPKIMEEYTETINANGENYKVGFMIRVKPDKIRASQKNKNIWVVNGDVNELRPYGILLKKL